jgi:hypothetical protein
MGNRGGNASKRHAPWLFRVIIIHRLPLLVEPFSTGPTDGTCSIGQHLLLLEMRDVFPAGVGAVCNGGLNLKFSAMDLVNVAMTCSRLAGPALDILWSEQSSLVPLIMCLPRDTWEIADQTIVSEVYHLSLDWTMLTVL